MSHKACLLPIAVATPQQHKGKQRYFPQQSGQDQDAQCQPGPDQIGDKQSGQYPARQYGYEQSGMKFTMDHKSTH